MKVVGFSPWQHVPTSIEGSRIVPKIIGRPSTSSSSSKRAKLSINSDKKSLLGGSSLDFQPDLVLSSDHQISVLGHAGSKRILKSSDQNSVQEDSISEVTRWIYTSRPGDKTSFLPKSPETEEIGAVVDPNSRSVFSLQNDNQMIKIWSLDEDVSGPDDNNEGEVLVKHVDLPSPVVSMDAIPFRKQTRVKIKDSESIVDPAVGILGGIAGSLANEQTFILIIDITRQVHLEIYGGSETKSSRRKSTSNTAKKNTSTKKHLYSVVSYNSLSSSPTQETGQKRKLDSIETSETDNGGEIVITQLCLDSKKSDGIEFAKHTITLHGIVDKISATYEKQSGLVALQHGLYNRASNGNGHAKDEIVRVTQLDPNHVALVYRSKDDGWFVTILDTKFGQSIVQQFPLLQKESATIVDIAGLSTSILAVLTSDHIITVYDVRRAIVLHEVNVYNAFPSDDTDGKYEFGMTSHWYSGTLGIVRKHVGSRKRKTGNENHTVVSFAKIGIFDNDNDVDESLSSKPALKGSYNLARAIASSMLTTSSMANGNTIPVLAIRDDFSVTDWLSISSNTKNKKNIDVDKLTQSIEEAGRNTNRKNGGKSTKLLSSAVEHAISTYSKKGDDLPQKIIDTAISLALSRLSSIKHTDSVVEDCIDTLLLCIKTGKVSGRDHLENSDFNFRSLLSLIRKSYAATATSKRNIKLSPVNVIYHLLRYCKGSLPEHALVSILHFVLCYITAEEFQQHWIEYSQNDVWYTDTSVKVLQKRLKKAVSQLNESKSSNGVKKLIEKIEKRLYTAHQLFFIEAIVSNSSCNSALLKLSLKEGLTHSDKGEVDVLIYALSQLLRKVGKSRKPPQSVDGDSLSKNTAQWLSAVVDSNLTSLIRGKGNKQTAACIELAKKEVSATIMQTNALLSLQDLMNHFDAVANNASSSKKAKEVASVPPLYGIEMLVF